jgi:hypothetical protein
MDTPTSIRPQIWIVIRALHRQDAVMTPASIRAVLVAPPENALEIIRAYLKALEAAGIVERIGDPGEHRYRLLRDEGVEAPRVRPDGRRVAMGQGREAMWRTMRILTRPWTARELAIHASTEAHPVALQEAQDYAQRLCRAGYLQRTAPQTYRLIPARYTGPKPPQVKRTKQIWDPNLGRVADWGTAFREVKP